MYYVLLRFFFFQAEDGIRDLVRSRGLGDVYKRQDKIRYRDAVDGLDCLDSSRRSDRRIRTGHVDWNAYEFDASDQLFVANYAEATGVGAVLEFSADSEGSGDRVDGPDRSMLVVVVEPLHSQNCRRERIGSVPDVSV